MMSDRLKKVCKVRGKSATGAWKPSPLPNYVQLNLSTLFYKRNQICNSIPNLNLTKISNNCLIPQINFPQILVFELNHWFSKLQYFILHKTVKNSTTYHPAAHTCTFTQYIAKIQKCPPLYPASPWKLYFSTPWDNSSQSAMLANLLSLHLSSLASLLSTEWCCTRDWRWSTKKPIHRAETSLLSQRHCSSFNSHWWKKVHVNLHEKNL